MSHFPNLLDYKILEAVPPCEKIVLALERAGLRGRSAFEIGVLCDLDATVAR